MPLQVRRGTDAERLAMTQPLASGELLYVTNEQKLYVGNGSTLGGIQITGYTDGDAKDSAAEIFTDGSHNGITFSYNTATNVMTANVNLSNYAGTIRADAFKGSLFADDGSTIASQPLVDAISGTFNGNLVGNVTGNLTGNSAGIHTGPVIGNVTGNVVGNVTGNTVGYHTGDVKGSVVGDDSMMLVDGVDGLIRGDVDNTSVITGNILVNKDLAEGGITIVTQSSLEDDANIFNIITAHDDSLPSGAVFSRSRGTANNLTSLNTDDKIFSLVFAGQSTADIQPSSRIESSVDGSVGSNIVPGRLAISTADSSGALVERLSIDSKGISEFTGMVIFATYASESAANTAVGGFPVNGMMYYDSGANKFKGYQNGGWVVLQP
jgi:hypothetical protein